MTKEIDSTTFERMVEQVRITDDIAFGNIIQKGDNCLHLLQAIFPELQITSIKFERQKQEKENTVFKGTVFDILATDQNGIVYDIEMQTSISRDLGKRVRYYQSKLDEITLNQGLGYMQLKRSFVVFICIDDPFLMQQRRYTFSHCCEEVPELRLPTGAKIIFLNSRGKLGQVSDSLQGFFDMMHGKINVKDKFICNLTNDLANLKQDPEWRREFMNLEMRLADARMDGVELMLNKYVTSLLKKNLSNQQIKKSVKETFGNSVPEELVEQLLK